MRHLVPSLFLLALILPASAAPSTRPAPYMPPVYQRDCRGKPAAAIGEVSLGILGRPAFDRVDLQATWRDADLGDARRLQLVLPEGAWIVSGPDVLDLDGLGPEGDVTWEVGFTPGPDLDVLVRLSAVTAAGPSATETAVCHCRAP
jgi:hypothetical protein